MLSALDYCNSDFTGLPKASTMLLQYCSQTNKAASSAKSLLVDNSIPSLALVKYWIIYKLCLMMHAANNHRCPGGITKLLTATSSVHSRSRLRLDWLPAASDSSKLWRESFLVCWTYRLEQPIEGYNGWFKAWHKTYLCALAYVNKYD